MQAGSRESQQDRQKQWPYQQGHSITVPDQEEQTVHEMVTSQQSRPPDKSIVMKQVQYQARKPPQWLRIRVREVQYQAQVGTDLPVA